MIREDFLNRKSMDKINIRGVELFPFSSRNQLADYVCSHPGILVAINAEKIINSTEQTRNIINRNIGYCDGAGPQMALRRMGYPDAIKVAGCELWLSLIERFYKEKTFYLIGAKQPVIDETVRKLHTKFPGINIVGYRNGYITTSEEKAAVIADVVAKKPDVVFVAMGSPKQELFMEEMFRQHKAIYQGLGGSFDVYTGRVKRAPQWWIDHRVEWLYRLVNQPSRIKRQAKLVKFAWWIATNKFSKTDSVINEKYK